MKMKKNRSEIIMLYYGFESYGVSELGGFWILNFEE